MEDHFCTHPTGEIVLTPIPDLKVFDPNECCPDEEFMNFEEFLVLKNPCMHCGWEEATEMYSTGNNPIQSPEYCRRCWEMLVRKTRNSSTNEMHPKHGILTI